MTYADVLNDFLTTLEHNEFTITKRYKNIDCVEAYAEGYMACFNWVKNVIKSEIQVEEGK